jgi:hypothetical protein
LNVPTPDRRDTTPRDGQCDEATVSGLTRSSYPMGWYLEAHRPYERGSAQALPSRRSPSAPALPSMVAARTSLVRSACSIVELMWWTLDGVAG